MCGLPTVTLAGVEELFQQLVAFARQLSIDHHNRIRTSDSRLLRRIVRDRRYRNIRADVLRVE